MENVKIREFLDSLPGYGFGRGFGFGSGFGTGSGSGRGSGRGDGCGYGSGSGYGSGDGCGYGSGRGYGSGYGSGFGTGSGRGDGSGEGEGSGNGFGDGSGDGIKSVNGIEICNIDGVQTAIFQIHGNIAKGAILQGDLTFTPCYIAKQDGQFAHGATVREAITALREKLFEDMPEEDRIRAFASEHPNPQMAYPNEDLFSWHHMLTGSCLAGRKAFVRDHGIDMDGSMTIPDFIMLTKNEYGGEVITRLEEVYHAKARYADPADARPGSGI